MPKRIAILGSTGSIGVQALDVISRYLGHFEIVALSANENIDLLTAQVNKYRPSYVAIADKEKANQFKISTADLKVDSGYQSLIDLAALPEVDIVLNAIVGIAGLRPTIAALSASKDVALANKESLVAAGSIVMETAKRNGCRVIPVDSEHSAIYQCLSNPNDMKEVRKIYLTASGGPFRELDRDSFKFVTVEQTLNHPNWNMGKKITVDSATLMNKGLEVIEAKWLFGLSLKQIEVIIHPQSVIHSMVEYVDGSVIAQIAPADMRLPILYALSQPQRLSSDIPKLNFFDLVPLTFEKPDLYRFPCLSFAYEALSIGGTMPTVLNAANEVAVGKFLDREISFEEIPTLVKKAMSMHNSIQNPSIYDILNADSAARLSFNT
jgi:1-deoxy-D-xylulose-5-phosphate reductoisomerase